MASFTSDFRSKRQYNDVLFIGALFQCSEKDFAVLCLLTDQIQYSNPLSLFEVRTIAFACVRYATEFLPFVNESNLCQFSTLLTQLIQFLNAEQVWAENITLSYFSLYLTPVFDVSPSTYK